MVSVSIRPRKPRELEREIHQDSVSDNLEAEGRAIVDQRGVRADDESIEGLIDREISLTLEHLEQARTVLEQQRRSISRIECYLDTEIMQRLPKPAFYYDTRIDERDRLRDR